MSVEVIGIDHIFVAVSDLRRSEGFYDRVMPVLGFRKGEGTIGGDPHLFYYNRQFVYSLRHFVLQAYEHQPSRYARVKKHDRSILVPLLLPDRDVGRQERSRSRSLPCPIRRLCPCNHPDQRARYLRREQTGTSTNQERPGQL